MDLKESTSEEEEEVMLLDELRALAARTPTQSNNTRCRTTLTSPSLGFILHLTLCWHPNLHTAMHRRLTGSFYSFPRRAFYLSTTIHHHPPTTSSTMKFLSPLVLVSFAASAWSTVTPGRSFSTTRSCSVVPATILHGHRLSFSDDIPLRGSTAGTYNVVIEIPKMTKAKMEVATKGSQRTQ